METVLALLGDPEPAPSLSASLGPAPAEIVLDQELVIREPERRSKPFQRSRRKFIADPPILEEPLASPEPPLQVQIEERQEPEKTAKPEPIGESSEEPCDTIKPEPVGEPQSSPMPQVSAKGERESGFVSWKPKRAPVADGLIFVAIASYRDTELVPTIQSMLEQAKFPEKLRFGICLQDTPQGLNEFPYYGDHRFRVIRVPAEKSRGCCWARAQMQTLYQGEQLYCQLDSHHRFVKHWDERAIWQLYHCKSSKPILTTYLPPYCPETAERDVLLTDLYSIAITGYDKRGLISFRPQLILADELPMPAPRPGFMIAGGFIFTLGEWVQEVPYDPRLYFNGEEISLTVRSWTHGWDIFCPNQVISFHYYQRKDEPKHWKDHEDWRTANSNSIDLVLQQLSSGQSGRYGLGSVRTLQQYQAMAGFDFESHAVSPAAKRGLVLKPTFNGTRPPDPPECYVDLIAQPQSLDPVDVPRPRIDSGRKALLPMQREAPALPSVPRAVPKSSLQPTKGLIRTNPSKLVKNLFPTPNPRDRRRIDYEQGYLAKDNTTGLWHEYKHGSNQRFATFQQRRGLPEDEFILLYDPSRELNLRIDGKGKCSFVQGKLYPDSIWRTNFSGAWQ